VNKEKVIKDENLNKYEKSEKFPEQIKYFIKVSKKVKEI
jgi:hypothetical protein